MGFDLCLPTKEAKNFNEMIRLQRVDEQRLFRGDDKRKSYRRRWLDCGDKMVGVMDWEELELKGEGLAGINVVVYYSTSIFRSAGIAFDVAESALVGASNVFA
ncbi:hypothetical protein Fmac_015404 [Flemingia macrophylla]|uniref:Uncharacterized protein n=1 Tax=Flemingia macrophylla TaxID=520843 RepID=A0ABD1MEI1_9FABA